MLSPIGFRKPSIFVCLIQQKSPPTLLKISSNSTIYKRTLFGSRPRVDQHAKVLFGEVDLRGGYSKPLRDSLTWHDRLTLLRKAWLAMPESAAQLKDFYLYDRVPFKMCDVRHSDYYYIGHFSRDGGHRNWIVTRDSHYGEGYSTGEFVPSAPSPSSQTISQSSTKGSLFAEDGEPNRCTGIFRGVLDTRVPNTGQLARAGYVNLRSPYALMINGRPRGINLQPLNCIVIRHRGDGRKYRINLHRAPIGKLDIELFDLYSFPLYTRGGPYWTVSKIPISKLMRVYKGRVQDKPCLADMSSYQHFSITLSDGIPGPFSLELDYVAAFYDAHLNEKFAYETYPVSTLMKNNLLW